MISPSEEYAESRPFKIFISLLDKWEIGTPLTEVLIYDALKAAKHLLEHPVDSSADVREQVCRSICRLTQGQIDFDCGKHTVRSGRAAAHVEVFGSCSV